MEVLLFFFVLGFLGVVCLGGVVVVLFFFMLGLVGKMFLEWKRCYLRCGSFMWFIMTKILGDL